MWKTKSEVRQINWSTQIYENPACGEIVASSNPEVAQRIVQCVNSHDALVEALDNLINKDLLKDEYHIAARQALAQAAE